MSALFDPFRSVGVAWDVGSVNGATPQQIAWRRMSRLAALFDAARASPLYRRHIGDRPGTDIALESMPVQHKRDLMRQFDQWVTDPALRLPQLQAFTADPNQIAEAFLGKYQVWESSGTSGTPAVFVQDRRAMAVYDALESLRRARPQSWANPMSMGQRIAFVGATSGHFASFVSMLRLQRLNPWLASSLRCFSIMQPMDALVTQLNEFSPSVIATYPTAASMLAGAAANGALRIALREVWTGGETLGRSMRERIEQQLDCTVRNSYGASEFLAMGWECAGSNMHLNADWVMLEPVDRHYLPVPAGETPHTVLLTNLANHVQPLIRYDLGDQVTFATEPCACGSPLPVIQVRGRHDDTLVMAGRAKRPVTLLPLALSTVMEDEAGVFDFQLRQRDAHTLVLRLGLRGEHAVAAAGRCHAALRSFCTDQGVGRLHLVNELNMAPACGRSGKVQRVIAMPAAPARSGAD